MAVIYGDSNVVKYLPLLKERKSDPPIQATTVSRATNTVLLQDLLSVPKSVHALVIISALTNLITSKFFDDYDLLIEHCRSTFTDVLLWLQEGREALSGFAETVLVMPPMIRKQPYWYDRWYGSIMIVFESIFRQPQVANVFVLPAFTDPVYDKDCVHLTEKSGIAFVAHILSQATTFAESPHSSNTESALNGVRSCVVGVVAAQDDTKADVIELSVKLAEEKDGRENTDHENRFLLAGLKVKKLPDWSARQAAYLAAVKDFLTKLKPEFSTLPVQFVRAIRYEPKLLLSVECVKAKHSRAVRTHWGHLVRTGVVKKEYKDISLNNVITLGTRVRIVVLRGIADSYRKLHPNGSATVTQFQPRPQLLVREQLTHRPTVYTYGEAVFSPVLPPPTPESLRLAHALASSFNFQGRVRKTFYVLTDNKVGSGPRLRPNSLAKEADKDSGQSQESSQPMETDPPAIPPVMSLSAKLAAKRKATDSGADSAAKARR